MADSIQRKFTELTELSAMLIPGSLEAERLIRDLERVRVRLHKGDYARVDYGGNIFDVRTKVKEFFTYMDFYMQVGRAWSAIFGELPLREYSRVIDLCPGWSPKIELGLYNLDFQGEVCVVDSCAESVDELVRFMGLFRHGLRFVPLVLDIFQPSGLSASLVVGNHLLDDLALGKLAPRFGLQPEELYRSEDGIRRAWELIISRRNEHLEELTQLVAPALGDFVAPGGYLILSQYAAFSERLLDLHSAVDFCRELMLSCASALSAKGFRRDTELAGRALAGKGLIFGADDCLVLRRS